MKAAFFILCSVLALSACKKQEETIAAPTPQAAADFTYKGRPVDPMCFNASMENSGVDADLAQCTGSVNKTADTMSEKGLETLDDGSIGYEFKCEEGCMRAPIIAYKKLGKVGDDWAIEVTSSGGGTGYFTSLGLYSLAADKLKRVKALTGGDRCNGGITDAKVVDGAVVYSVNITPFDLIQLSGGNQAGFEAYNDIENSAASCIGEAAYKNEDLQSVTLTLDPKEEVPENLGPMDTCFYGTYNETYFSGTKTLAGDALKNFGQTFNNRCAQLKRDKSTS